jgi:hypothetical protein
MIFFTLCRILRGRVGVGVLQQHAEIEFAEGFSHPRATSPHAGAVKESLAPRRQPFASNLRTTWSS